MNTTKELEIGKEYFSAQATLECGQTFRFERDGGGYFVCAGERACRITETETSVKIDCKAGDAEYFSHYFDLSRDYSQIVSQAEQTENKYLCEAARYGKGIRILNQAGEEMIVTFLLSQNNNIPRIKQMVSRLCAALGEKRNFYGREYRAFPSAQKLAEQDAEFYKKLGFGYRAEYIASAAREIAQNGAAELSKLETGELRERLLKMRGVGRKVADCILLFGFHRTDAFPVDVWTERVYRERLGGTEKNREKAAKELEKKYGEFSGYFQQYMFYYEREGVKYGEDHDR